MLRILRITVATIGFVVLTLFFLDYTDTISPVFGSSARLQIVPAIMTGSFVILAGLLLATILFGRLYCSILCPLGILQDLIRRISLRFQPKKKGSYSPKRTGIQLFFLALALVFLGTGFTFGLALLDPYSIFGRIVANLFSPIVLWGNNLAASIFTLTGNYFLYGVAIVYGGTVPLLISFLMLGLIGYMSWRFGRLYCNTVCPVGTFLGLLSRLAIFRFRIDSNRCSRCGLCSSHCKSSCINIANHTIDTSRCVVCFDCTAKCPKNAIQWNIISKRKKEPVSLSENVVPEPSKRCFIATLLSVGGVVSTVVPKASAETLEISWTGNKPYKRKLPLTPPGSVSAEQFQTHCTSCHLCVVKCPSKVLKPALMEYGLKDMLQPVMSFEHGFCNYDCTVCGAVCPNRAIRPLILDEKHLNQGGRVVFIEENCIVRTNGTSCGACSEHCPTQAVHMVPYEKEGTDGLMIPEINEDLCVGCGACEYICPVRPFRAIHIDGLAVHQKATPPVVEQQEEGTAVPAEKETDFGF